MRKVRKAIVPIAGLGTRFLPFSKTLSKELFPLADLPMLQYLLKELKDSKIKEVIFVNRPEKAGILDYFKPDGKLKEILRKRGKKDLLKEVADLERITEGMVLRQVFQKEPLGAAHAVLQAKKYVKNEPCAVLWADDLVASKVPCTKQLMDAFENYQRPITALYRVPKESFKYYGMADAKKIGNRIFKINKFVEKPKTAEKAPSNLAVVGKYIITPDVFDILGKIKFDLKSDLSMTEILSYMAENGKDVYGCEFEGKWLECGNKLAYLKTNIYFILNHPKYGKEIRKYIKQEKLC
ncbi:MAG: UTP--glucose-1-phosphate uridylyltransferase [Candidatus Paceibacterota bacterium]|jgi:UTP--glucose-1-phosphate uridylyltransferase